MKIKCSVCGFENNTKRGNYCVRCRSVLIKCTGNCKKCVKRIISDYTIDKHN